MVESGGTQICSDVRHRERHHPPLTSGAENVGLRWHEMSARWFRGGTQNRALGRRRQRRHYLRGSQVVSWGGMADATTVSSGGTLDVQGTATSDVAVDAGGVENVSSGGVISGAPNSGTGISGGTVNVLSGGSAVFLGVSSGGTLNVSAGAAAADFTVSSGGTANVQGTVTSIVDVDAGGIVNVLSGGTASNTTILGGSEVVSFGGTAVNAAVSSGSLVVAVWRPCRPDHHLPRRLTDGVFRRYR